LSAQRCRSGSGDVPPPKYIVRFKEIPFAKADGQIFD
jgi:hypothetical protein